MSLKRLLFVVFALLTALSFNCGRVAAQTMTTGGIAGVVTNPKNAVVPNATVTLTSNAKGTKQTTATSDTGTYQFGLLDPGSYTVTVTMTGFQQASKEVTVPLGAPVMVDFELSVKAKLPTERVGPSLVERENGNLDITLTHQQVQQVPNPGNDMTYLAQLSPGTIMNTEGGTGNFSNYGMPATSNRFSLNGMTDNEPFENINNSGATRLLLGTNEIQEVNIVSNGYTGNYGEFAGETVNYVTSSGGNTVHGNATYGWNSRLLNANDFFNNASATPRPFDTAHQWSASLGGPLKKDKLFFFFNTEGLRVLIPTSPLVVLPSPQFENATITNLQNIGRFDVANFYQSSIFGNLNNAPNANSALDNQFPGQFTDVNNQVVPTGDGCGGFNQNPLFFGSGAQPCSLGFRATASNFTHEMQFAGRVDYIAGAKDRVFVRYERDMGTQATYTDPINSVFNVQSSQPEDQGQLEWTHAFGPSTANQFLVSGQWYSAVFDNVTPTGGIFPTTLGLADGTFFNTAGPNPCANPPVGPGFPLLLGGRDCINPQGRSTSQVQVSDDLSKTFGRQTIKIGGQFRRVDVSDHDFGLLQSGLLIVNTINDFYNGGATGDTFRQSFPQSLDQPIAYYTSGGYLEDDWRWSKTLNFTFAVRVEHDSNPICRHLCFAQLAAPFNVVAGIGCATNTDGTQTCSGNNQAFLQNVPYNQAINVNKLQALPGFQNILIQPRFGFAWQPFGAGGKTVVRGGAGIFYNMFPVSVVDNFAQNPPNDATFVSTNDFIVPAASAIGSSIFEDSTSTNTAFQNGFVTGETLGTIQANDPAFTPPNIFTSEAQTKVPRYYKWNLQMQHQLGGATSVSIGYVGNRGKHEPVIDNSVNAFGFGNLPVQAADPRFTGVTTLYAGGSSKYDGGTVTLIHRLTGAWGTGIVQASYTYSHASDEVSNGGFFPFSSSSLLNPQDPFSTHGDYGPADYDARHSVNANFVWQLPIRRLAGAHFSNRLTEGWELSGTVFARSGFPYSVVDGTLSSDLATSNNYFSQVIPQFLGGPDTCSVTSAGANCFGSAGEFNVGGEPGFTTGQRNIFRGPDYINIDAALMKFTRIPGWDSAR
ncbi:MAG TPA: carboxypeptidase-like regulatory domain-containing protein, partial [Candidatus Acidoferrales bacterium]|nr:carboxypeptidase-like regulatory domain-containing protein [Candidatus Acidoferrales bacterium]